MKKTFLAFSTTETLSSFMSICKGINVSMLPKMRIVKGLFTDEEVEVAKTQYKATVITTINKQP